MFAIMKTVEGGFGLVEGLYRSAEQAQAELPRAQYHFGNGQAPFQIFQITQETVDLIYQLEHAEFLFVQQQDGCLAAALREPDGNEPEYD